MSTIVDGWHYVYEIRDGDELLYVGCTGSPEKRAKAHQACKFLHVEDYRFCIVAGFMRRLDAYAYELQLIKRLRPPENKLGKPSEAAA